MNTKPIHLPETQLSAVQSALLIHIKDMERFVLTDPETWTGDLAAARAALMTIRKAKYPSLTEADFAQFDKARA